MNKIAFLLSLALVVPISADQQEKLTGDDVVKLLEAKIRQSLIVEIVKSTPGSYDLNAEAVKALRQHGATQPVLDAMRAHAPTPAAPASTSPLLAAIPSRFPREDVLRTRAAGMQGEQCQQDFYSTEDCHANYPTGCTDSDNPQYDAYLNYLKNKTLEPSTALGDVLGADDLDRLEQDLPDTLTIRTHGQHAAELASDDGEGRIVSVVGTLFYAYHSGQETCNCYMSGADDVVDYHIGVGFTDFPASDKALQLLRDGSIRSDRDMTDQLSTGDVNALKKHSFIVEMTPYFRFLHPELGWTLTKVQTATGRKVRVTGQLMVDNAHHGRGDDCGLAGHTAHCWRSTIWEVHPVTRFEVCTGTSCGASSGDWVALKDFH